MQLNNSYSCRRFGVSHTEVLVAGIVVLLMVALFIPWGQESRTISRQHFCKNNLRKLGIALHNYHEFHGSFPPGWIGVTNHAPAATGNNGITLFYALLSFLEAAPVYDKMNKSILQNGHVSHIAQTKEYYQSVFICDKDVNPQLMKITKDDGSDLTALKSNYAGVFGANLEENTTDDSLLRYYLTSTPEVGLLSGNGCFSLNSSVYFRDITDGTSQTFFIGEIKNQDLHKPDQTTSTEPYSGAWLAYIPQSTFPAARFLRSADVPINSTSSLSFGSLHKGGAQFCFVEGAVRFLNENIDPKLFKALGSINDGIDSSSETNNY